MALGDQEKWECPTCQAGIDHFDVAVPEEIEEPHAEGQPAEAEAGSAVGEDVPTSARKVSAHRADNSVFELHRQRHKGQLVLQPSFQRYYVWSDNQASKLIESIFLKLPIPIIYLAEEQAGGYSVIDGQQRLTALFQYLDNIYPLGGLEVLKDLNGKRFSQLSKEGQGLLESYVLTVVRIDRESHPDIKFEVFERLNTGSVKLNDQEVRNAVYRGPYNDHLRTLARNSTFWKLLGQTDAHKRMSDVELALRFAAWYHQTYLNFGPRQLKPYLNDEMENGRRYSAKEFADLERQFKKAMDLSQTVFGSKAFKRFIPGDDGDPNGQWELKQINKALFDVVTYGFTRYNKNQIVPHSDAIFEGLVDLMSTNARFVDAITSGTAQPQRVKARFELWLDVLAKIVGDDVQQRNFSASWKEQLWKADPTCALCGQKIQTVDDAHVHHVEHYWRGGATLPQNSQLTHRFCNLSEGGGSAGETPSSGAEAAS